MDGQPKAEACAWHPETLPAKPALESIGLNRPEGESKALQARRSRSIQRVRRETLSPSTRHSSRKTQRGRILAATGKALRRKACHACLGTPNVAAANCSSSRILAA